MVSNRTSFMLVMKVKTDILFWSISFRPSSMSLRIWQFSRRPWRTNAPSLPSLRRDSRKGRLYLRQRYKLPCDKQPKKPSTPHAWLLSFLAHGIERRWDEGWKTSTWTCKAVVLSFVICSHFGFYPSLGIHTLYIASVFVVLLLLLPLPLPPPPLPPSTYKLQSLNQVAQLQLHKQR